MTTSTTLGANARELRALLVPFISKRVEPQDVDDVLQTVFVRIQRGLADLRDSDKLVAWAYQVARNAIVDHARHAAVRKHDELDQARTAIAPSGETDDAGARELAIILGHFIHMLPSPYGEALQLTELDGITQVEAARRLGLSVSGMKSRVQRARAQLRELLESCCDIELDTRGGIVDLAPRNRPAALPDCCARVASFAASSAPDVRLPSMTTTNQAMNPTSSNPETTQDAAAGCCGGPAPAGADACCVKDAAAKAAGETGCGCGSKPAAAKKSCC